MEQINYGIKIQLSWHAMIRYRVASCTSSQHNLLFRMYNTLDFTIGGTWIKLMPLHRCPWMYLLVSSAEIAHLNQHRNGMNLVRDLALKSYG